MTIRSKTAAGASALLISVVSLPGVAASQTRSQALLQDCVRRVAPPSSTPHDVFRRTVCVPRNATALSEGRCRNRCSPLAPRGAMPRAPSTGPSQPDQGAL